MYLLLLEDWPPHRLGRVLLASRYWCESLEFEPNFPLESEKVLALLRCDFLNRDALSIIDY